MDKCGDIGVGALSFMPLDKAHKETPWLHKTASQHGVLLAEVGQEQSLAPTFEQAAREIHKMYPAWGTDAKHAQQWINTLVNYVFPVFGSMSVDEINTPEVLKVLFPIWQTKPDTARRVRQHIKIVFDWAKVVGFRSGDNPVEGITKVLPKQPSTQEPSTVLPYSEIPEFIRMLHNMDARKTVLLAFEFLILTATRTNEVVNATWPEMNFKNKIWTIPGSRMKTKREHRIPLSRRCIEILKKVRRISKDNLYVFPDHITSKPLSNMVFLMLLRRMKLDITTRSFRSSFKNWASECINVPYEACEAALACSKYKTRGDLFDKHLELMESWSKFANGYKQM